MGKKSCNNFNALDILKESCRVAFPSYWGPNNSDDTREIADRFIATSRDVIPLEELKDDLQRNEN
jgi:hypothetical protein